MELEAIEWMGNTIMNLVLASVAALIVILLVPLAKNIALSYAKKHAIGDKLSFWDILAACLAKTYFPVILIFAIYAATKFLIIPESLSKFVSITVVFAGFLQVAIWVNALVDLYATNYQQRMVEAEGQASTALALISFFAKLVLIAVVLLVALDQLGLNVTTFIAGLGVGGIAVALAVQNILGDLFASLTIVLDKPFQVGDFLIVGEQLGTVERVGLKTTRLRSLSGEQLIFSNNDLLQSRIRNYKRMDERRVVFGFGILYETPLEKTKAVAGWVREIIEGRSGVRFDRSHFKGFGAYSLDFEVVYYVLSADYNIYMDIQQDINIALFERLQAEGVEFAYPTQKLYLEGQVASNSDVQPSIPGPVQ